MKIAITGAHRVGKTSLIEELLESLPGYTSLQEPYYELEESGYMFSEIPGYEDYLAQLKHAIQQISISECNIIFDRCPVDLLAYLYVVNESDDIQSLYHLVENAMKEIDLLVFLPIEEPDLIGCTGSDMPDLRDRVDEILHDWVWESGIETIEVTGTIISRKNQVINKVAALNNK